MEEEGERGRREEKSVSVWTREGRAKRRRTSAAFAFAASTAGELSVSMVVSVFFEAGLEEEGFGCWG